MGSASLPDKGSAGKPAASLTPDKKARFGHVAKTVSFLIIAGLFLSFYPKATNLVSRYSGGSLISGAGRSKLTLNKYAWQEITPRSDLKYYPCLDDLQCARLEVPMDWNRTDGQGSKVAIAIAKLPARVPVTDPRYGGAVLLNPGGPGGSGVKLLIQEGRYLQQIVDASVSGPSGDAAASESAKFFDIIGFDPRGVNNTTPTLSCFPDAYAKEVWMLQQEAEGVLGSSEYALANQWARSKALFHGCSQANATEDGARNELGHFMNTSPVARDMVEIVERHGQWRENEATRSSSKISHALPNFLRRKRTAEPQVPWDKRWQKGQEKLLYIGFSYGTVLGSTFAAMFPDRIGRAVIDGVVDMADYYRTGWLTNLADTDAILDQFSKYCWDAGPERCALYTGINPVDIKDHFYSIVESVKGRPLAVEASETRGPSLITYSDIRNEIFNTLYVPVERFPPLARLLADVALGNGTSFADHEYAKRRQISCTGSRTEECSFRYETLLEANVGILCSDGESTTHTTPELFESYWKTLQGQSKLIGDMWASITLPCVGWQARPNWKFGGSISGNTSHPLLIVGNTFDPVTPLQNAHKLSEQFPGSVVLQQDSEGHCFLAAPSICTAKNIRRYFQTGELPKPGTICEDDVKPFLGSKLAEGQELALSEEDQDLLRVVKQMPKAFPN